MRQGSGPRTEKAVSKCDSSWSAVACGSMPSAESEWQEPQKESSDQQCGAYNVGRVRMPPSMALRSTHDLGVDAPRRRTQRALHNLQEVAGLDALEDLLEAQGWSSNINGPLHQASEAETMENLFGLVPGAPKGDCNVETFPNEQRRHSPTTGRNAPRHGRTEQTTVKAAPCPVGQEAANKKVDGNETMEVAET